MKEQILSDKQRRAKRIYGTVGIAFTVLCFILSYFYRPYAYSHHLNDFHLADIIPVSLACQLSSA